MAFTAFFKELRKACHFQFGWKHIHGYGITAIVTDMCWKQASGMDIHLFYVHLLTFKKIWSVFDIGRP